MCNDKLRNRPKEDCWKHCREELKEDWALEEEDSGSQGTGLSCLMRYYSVRPESTDRQEPLNPWTHGDLRQVGAWNSFRNLTAQSLIGAKKKKRTTVREWTRSQAKLKEKNNSEGMENVPGPKSE